MSNRLFQGLVHQMRDSIDATIGVVDETATIIACSDLSRVGTTNEFVSLDLSDSHDIFIRDGFTYKPFGSRVKPDYAVFVEGVDDAAAKYASILAVSLSNIKQYYDEKYDRNNFIKNVILDNVLPGDIVIKARELHFNAEISRAVFLIRIVSANDISAYDVIQNLFPDKNKDFVFNITESDIVLVKELKSTVDARDLEKLARSIADTLSSEFYTRVNVGIGTAVVGVKDLARSFKEAQMALEVGKVFDTDKVIVTYDNLGIARLIMVHGDNSGLVIPPRTAPTQVMIVPIQQRKAGVLEKAFELKEALGGFRVKVDDSDKSPGFKFADQEMRGIPLRVEIGPRDIQNGKCIIARRDNGEKEECALEGLSARIGERPQETENIVGYRVTIRFREDIEPTDEILWRGKRLELISPPYDVESRRIWTVMECREMVENGTEA